MNSPTIFMAILVLAVDFSLATSKENLLSCGFCNSHSNLKQVSPCSHVYCGPCKSKLLDCLLCKKNITMDIVKNLRCSICNNKYDIFKKSDKVYCSRCNDLGNIPQEIEASLSKQILVPQEIEASSFSQSKVPQETEASSSRQNVVPNEFINYSPDNEIRNQSTNYHNQDNEGNSTYKIKVTLDSNGNPFYDFLEVNDD
ncbi:uncharacterized protein LOC126897467 isoform X5 [Daktulosphaira vitifoliae]|uniref:uncharacterized protein LOC126897467 isoform X5 n=1 Tax=Daktulosphaira vitifoliae TaxID=58002 RepID=UPI0021A98B40|nr:uncharacterized protein LOC126897467 isoform X5 [Daktulosphaira vitifoliae]